MLKKSFFVLLFILTQGCTTSNQRLFRPEKSTLQHVVFSAQLFGAYGAKNTYVAVKSKNPQQNSIDCGRGELIYLPNKIPFQEYIQQSFNRALKYVWALAPDRQSASCIIDVFISNITADHLSGEWTIIGTLSVNGEKPRPLKSTINYKPSPAADTLCKEGAFLHQTTEELIRVVLFKTSYHFYKMTRTNKEQDISQD